jgi:hypothetical protein
VDDVARKERAQRRRKMEVEQGTNQVRVVCASVCMLCVRMFVWVCVRMCVFSYVCVSSQHSIA